MSAGKSEIFPHGAGTYRRLASLCSLHRKVLLRDFEQLMKNPAVAGVGRAERLAAQQFVDAGFAARFFIDLFDDDGAVEAVAAIRCGQVAGDDD